MELNDHVIAWVKGEVLQGKIMLVFASALLIMLVFILKGDHDFLRGMAIPLGLIVLLIGGYGAFQVIARPGHASMVSKLMNEDPQLAIQKEYEKAMKDDKAYSTLKPIWAVLIALSVGLYLYFSAYYFKGLSIGLMGLFMSVLILDSVLQYRLDVYLKALKSMI